MTSQSTMNKLIEMRLIAMADAINNRIAHDSYRINITSIGTEHDISMHEIYGLDKALLE